MTIAYPVATAWLSTGDHDGLHTGAPNYDEFADEAEITRIIAANPASALAVEMPHRAPDAAGARFTLCLPAAAARLAWAKSRSLYRRHDDVAVLYRITGPDGPPGYGLWAMVDTAEISTRAGEPGLVIRNEDVFPEKVRERVALIGATGHLLSPVLLVQTAHGPALARALADAVAQAGTPAARDTDQAGRVHEIWPLGAGATRDHLLALAGGGELVVADGNHRSLAAQNAGLDRFLAVVTTAGSVTIEPYNRLVTELTTTPDELWRRLGAAGARVRPGVPARVPAGPGEVVLYHGGVGYAVELPARPGADEVDNLDHALVERVLLRDALGLDAGDKRVTYVGGDYPAAWLTGAVDAGRAALAVLVAPVRVDDFVAVNLARRKLPRKSTWFTPKARAGLVLAEVVRAGAPAGGTPAAGS